MPSRAEELTSRSLRAILGPLAKGTNLQDSEEFQDVLVDLEYFVPELLAEVYSEWNHEALDGIMPMLARKTGEATAEIFGLCFIMSEQILAPIQMSLRISASSDEVSWLECRLGEKGAKGMLRIPFKSLDAAFKRLRHFEGRAQAIQWFYKIEFGKKEPPGA